MKGSPPHPRPTPQATGLIATIQRYVQRLLFAFIAAFSCAIICFVLTRPDMRNLAAPAAMQALTILAPLLASTRLTDRLRPIDILSCLAVILLAAIVIALYFTPFADAAYFSVLTFVTIINSAAATSWAVAELARAHTTIETMCAGLKVSGRTLIVLACLPLAAHGGIPSAHETYGAYLAYCYLAMTAAETLAWAITRASARITTTRA